jgi:hypothetical protein
MKRGLCPYHIGSSRIPVHKTINGTGIPFATGEGILPEPVIFIYKIII